MAIKKLDVVTQVCPFPLIEAKAALAEMASGDELVIEFDCTQATEAIPQWAAEEGHAITDYQQIGDAAWSITRSKSLTQNCPPPYQRRRLHIRQSLPRTAKALLTAPLFLYRRHTAAPASESLLHSLVKTRV